MLYFLPFFCALFESLQQLYLQLHQSFSWLLSGLFTRVQSVTMVCNDGTVCIDVVRRSPGCLASFVLVIALDSLAPSCHSFLVQPIIKIHMCCHFSLGLRIIAQCHCEPGLRRLHVCKQETSWLHASGRVDHSLC